MNTHLRLTGPRGIIASAALAATLSLTALSTAHATPKPPPSVSGIDPSTIGAISVTSFPCASTPTGLTSISGQITFSKAPAAGATLNLAVYVHIQPADGGDHDFHLITTPGFNANYNGTQTQATIIGVAGQTTYNYTVSFTSIPKANSYRIQVGSPYTEDQSQNLAKSQSVSCPVGPSGGTPPPVTTPEPGTGELFATGLLPVAVILLYRRRRNSRAS